MYLFAFGPTLLKFLELTSFTPELNTSAKSKNSSSGKIPAAVGHTCSMSAQTVRDEVEVLKNDFNDRLKQVLFNTLLVVHGTLLPCYFAQVRIFQHCRPKLHFSYISCNLIQFTFTSDFCEIIKYVNFSHL